MKWMCCLSMLFISIAAYAREDFLIDRYYSPFMGSADLFSIQKLILFGEDKILDEGADFNWTMRTFGRTLEQALWYNIDLFSAVTEHEVFGHGYRTRQVGLTPEGYRLTPWGGSTSLDPSSSFKVGKYDAIVVAGVEAEAIMGRDIKMQWMRAGAIDGRLAMTYTQTQQSVFWYTLVTHLGNVDTDSLQGNDIATYIYLLNTSYHDHYTHGKLMKLSSYNLLDPMTFYAYYAFWYYIFKGAPFQFPMFALNKEINYLPNIRIGYAPYAPETYFENFFTFRGEPLYIYVKGGRRSYGAGAAYDKLWCNDKYTIGFRFDFWNQSNFISSATLQDLKETGTAFRPSLKERHFGLALSMTGSMVIHPQIALTAELGAKSAGYLPGYSLYPDIIARIGLQFYNF